MPIPMKARRIRSHSGMRHLAQARNPYSRSWLWIPGSRVARPGMTILNSRNRLIRHCRVRHKLQQSRLAALDLQRKIFRIDAALRDAAGDQPEAGLPGAGEHVAHLLIVAEPPDRADAFCHCMAEQL